MNEYDRLVVEARRGLDLIGENPANWVPHHPGIDHDVVVVGGGQSGLAIAFGLKRAGIGKVQVIDAARAGAEGIWRTIARMEVLRTAKAPPGPELGLPDFSFQAWYEATHGAAAYAALGNIPRPVWADYLDWFRQAADIRVRNAVRLVRVEPLPDLDQGVLLFLETPDGLAVETTRKLVLATGFAGGGGGGWIPPGLSDGLPGHVFAHTADQFDLSALKGLRVGVLGAASSAFDAAASALEAGAAEVHLFCRNPDLARGTRMKNFGFPGAAEHFHALEDADRWRVMRVYRARGTFPPQATIRRATAFANFHLHLGTGWAITGHDGTLVQVETSKGERQAFDFLIFGTGYATDFARVPELASLSHQIALWSDRFVPPAGEEDAGLASSPYLDAGFRFTERVAGTAAHLHHIHFLGFAGMLSQGRPVGDIASLRHNVPRLVSAIGRDLFLADRQQLIDRMLAPTADDLLAEDYESAIVKGRAAALSSVK